jgi:hypothetical protein
MKTDLECYLYYERGKEEQIKVELDFLKRFRKYCFKKGFAGGCIWIDTRIKELEELK